MESQWGPNKAGCWYCPLYLQKTINSHFCPPWWRLFGPLSAAQRRRKSRDEILKTHAAGLFGYLSHLGIFFSCDPGDTATVFLWQWGKTAHSAIMKSSRHRWSEKGVISYCAEPYALASPFSSDGLRFYEVQKLYGWHSSWCLSSSQLKSCQWPELVVAVWRAEGQMTHDILWHICKLIQTNE